LRKKREVAKKFQRRKPKKKATLVNKEKNFKNRLGTKLGAKKEIQHAKGPSGREGFPIES